jgi:bifunctional non-homologous end joining protein LigD
MEKSIELFYREGSSDKIYQASIDKKGSGFVVNFAYGRRGTTLKTGTKTQEEVSAEEALKIYTKLVNSKMSDGYKPVEGQENGSSYNHVDKDQLQTGIHVQLLNPIEEDEVSKYINDDRYLAQEKFDGRRNPLKKVGDTLTAINRKGLSVGYPIAFDFAKKLPIDFVLDGEAIGDKLYVFDLLEIDGKDIRNNSAEERLKELEKVFKKFFGKSSPFVMTETAYTKAEKQKLYDDLKKRNAEGLVFKLKTSPYTAGRPASGGNQIKFKFVATASFEVIKVNKKRSVAVGLYDIGSAEIVNVGNVTIPPNKEVPNVGDIIEVQYLYAYKGGSIYQPVYLMKRDDIDWKDCLISQLKYKATSEEEDEN